MGRIERRIHTELRDSILGDHQTALGIGLVADRRRVHAINVKVIVVATARKETDARPVSGSGIDGSGDESHQVLPVAPIDRELADLGVL